jgi:peptidyl-prolyl cis-trans isomerase D
MLQSIRDKVTGIFAYVILGAIAVVFVLWGVNSRNEVSASYAAEVNGDRITVEEARRAWQDQQARFQGQLPAELEKSMQQSTLDQLIRNKVLEQRVDGLGYRTSNHALIERIQGFPATQVDGKFSRERYAAILHQQGRSEAQFEDELRTSLAIETLQAGVAESAFVTPAEAARRFALDKEQREVDMVLVPVKSFLDGVKMTDADVQKSYEAHLANYMTPERVDLEYVEVQRADVESQIKVSDAELKDYYEQVKAKYETQERRRARHILIAVGNGVEDAAAKKQADELYAKIKAGADFATLAKESSKDPVSAKLGGDLDWATRGTFVGPFEDTLFGMTKGEVRGPIKTQFGYHIIRLDDIEPAHTQSFDEARAELEADYRKDKSQTLFYDLTQKLADQSFSAQTELTGVAKTLGTALKTVKGFTREGGGEFAQNKQVIDAAFSKEVLDEGHNSPMIALDDDHAIVLRVAAHQPSEPRPLAEVRADVETKLKQEMAQSAATRKGADALAQLQGGAAWDKVVAELGYAPTGKRSVGRTDSSVPVSVLTEAFKIPRNDISSEKPRYVGAVTADGNYAILAVSGIKVGDPAVESPRDLAARTKRDSQQIGDQEFGLYVEGAVKDASVKRNPATFQ